MSSVTVRGAVEGGVAGECTRLTKGIHRCPRETHFGSGRDISDALRRPGLRERGVSHRTLKALSHKELRVRICHTGLDRPGARRSPLSLRGTRQTALREHRLHPKYDDATLESTVRSTRSPVAAQSRGVLRPNARSSGRCRSGRYYARKGGLERSEQSLERWSRKRSRKRRNGHEVVTKAGRAPQAAWITSRR